MPTYQDPGYVYVASNPSYNCVKIGYTTNHPEYRLSLMNKHVAVPTPFVIECAYYVQNSRRVEGLIHRRLKDCQVGKEFYDVKPQKVADILKYEFGGVDWQEHMAEKNRPAVDSLADILGKIAF